MKYQSRDFGLVEVSDDRVLNFVKPVLGYEQYKRYTLLYDEEIGTKLIWLQSLEEEELCLILADPTILAENYQPVLPEEVTQTLGNGNYICLVVAVVPEDLSKATVNLKSPIVINTDTRQAMQVVLSQDYPIRTRLFAKGKEPC